MLVSVCRLAAAGALGSLPSTGADVYRSFPRDPGPLRRQDCPSTDGGHGRLCCTTRSGLWVGHTLDWCLMQGKGKAWFPCGIVESVCIVCVATAQKPCNDAFSPHMPSSSACSGTCSGSHRQLCRERGAGGPVASPGLPHHQVHGLAGQRPPAGAGGCPHRNGQCG